MLNFLIFLAIIILFYLLAKSADLVVDSIRKIGHHFAIPIAFLGFLLGFLTSLPELSVAVNSSARNLGELSFGNLLGGIVLLFGLILGTSIFISRPVVTDGDHKTIIPILLYSFLPFVFGLNGEISMYEGIAFIIGYFALIFFLFEEVGHKNISDHKTHHSPARSIFLALIGITALLVVSNIIVRLTETLLEAYNVPAFVIGFILFAFGTNLPEIAVLFRAFKKHIPNLSTSSIFGSAIANVFIVGMLALMRPVPITKINSHIFLTIAVFALFIFVLRFYLTEKRISKKEGAMLALLYFGIIMLQIILL